MYAFLSYLTSLLEYNSEAQYKAYMKRVKSSGFSKEEYEKQKSLQSPEEFYPTTETLKLGHAPKPTKEQVDRMAKELENTYISIYVVFLTVSKGFQA
jgi:hypothetical protein